MQGRRDRAEAGDAGASAPPADVAPRQGDGMAKAAAEPAGRHAAAAPAHASVWPADAAGIARAARRLADGGLVAFPTETVYGLGARADDARAVAAVFALKGRPADHPLIVHVADAAAAEACFAASVDDSARRLMAAAWPGPLTVIVPRRPGVADAAAGGHPTIGLRMPSHPAALALLRAAAALGVPGVAAPSANRFGRISPTTAAHVHAAFGTAVPVLDGGPCDVGIESAIVDCSGPAPALLRPGGLDAERIARWLDRPLAAPGAQAARAPGTLAAHYAPSATLQLWSREALGAAVAQRLAAVRATPAAAARTAGLSQTVAVYSRTPWAGLAADFGEGPPPHWQHRRMPGDAAAAAHELFAVLRELDAAGVSAIWVEEPPAGTAWDGVRDRLRRAAS